MVGNHDTHVSTPMKLVGEVISKKMQKTITVRVERTFTDPYSKKVLRRSKKYHVHDEQEQANVGDVVEIYEGRPVSKTKFMYLGRTIKSQPQGETL
jgi:small subunit ribosomal protein S17